MNELEKYIKGLEVNHTALNPQKSEWRLFSRKLLKGYKNNGLFYTAVLSTIVVFVISGYYFFNQSEIMVDVNQQKGEIMVIEDSAIHKELVPKKDSEMVVYNKANSDELLKNLKPIKKEVPLLLTNSLDTLLMSESFSSNNIKINLNQFDFCQGDTLIVSYEMIENIDRYDSISTFYWEFNDKEYNQQSLSVCLKQLVGDVTGNLVVEIDESLIIKTFKIHVHPIPKVDFKINDLQTFKKSVSISVSGLDDYTLTVNDEVLNHHSEYEFQSPSNYIFNLLGKDSYGCSVNMKKEKKIIQSFNLFVPTAFTPNDDAYNNVFKPSGLEQIEYPISFSIFNQQGSIVYTSNEKNAAWNGVNQNGQIIVGDYVWKLTVYNHSEEIYKGKVTLIK